ncbi:MAG: alpha/beta hydrolase family protein [Limisphaerales bacterium]
MALTYFSLALFSLAHAQDLRFTTSVQTTNGIFMQWSNAVPGQAYTLQSRDRLTNSIWLVLDSPQPWPTVQTQWNDTLSSTQLMRFYRVVAVPPATRGKLLSSSLVGSYSTTTLNLYFSLYGVNLTAQYGVNWYRVVYETIDPLGGRTTASGGLFLPAQTGVNWPLLSYSHGTLTQTNQSPSTTLTEDSFAGLAFASFGYASVVADLLGFGASPGLHPYLHARSEATASVDMLRAARNYCASNSIGLNGQLFIAGYSQGGHTAMALHRELERYHTNEFTVTASAPMAGPYDMSGVELNDILSARCPPNPYYAAYVLVAYQSVYVLAPSWSNLVVAPYASTIPPLFNGNTSGATINSAMPACNISTIFTPAVIASLTNDPGCPLYQALRDNDLYRWKPVAPMRLYQCSGDLDVLPANSQVAYDSFQAQGATQVQLIDPMPGADHSTCAIPCLEAAKAWFDTLKQ